MAKLTRVYQKQFGVDAGNSDVGVFGSLAASSPQYSKDPETIQSLNAFLTGWAAETIANNRPALEDFNALDFLSFYQICYLFQAGIPEWDAETTYYENSICQVDGVLYRSLQDDNLNEDPETETAWWELVVNDFVPSADNALAGSVVQVVNYQTGEFATGTTQTPLDDTIPQNTEGTEFMTLAITPKSATNKLKIDVVFICTDGGWENDTVALFKDADVSALACASQISGAGAAYFKSISFTHYMTSGTTDEITFKVRAGTSSGGTIYFNGSGGARKFGGVLASSITITEIKA